MHRISASGDLIPPKMCMGNDDQIILTHPFFSEGGKGEKKKIGTYIFYFDLILRCTFFSRNKKWMVRFGKHKKVLKRTENYDVGSEILSKWTISLIIAHTWEH